ncbi:hypothetical protein [Novosphingobium olei]|uniref:hypothetical protein n=1 Tax=Novosphingobium olei TaxID=2728851 RepID=UPI0030854ACF|nr:right-handed parallel beta-helix repeat-containing protein [Novosphingobium olei]
MRNSTRAWVALPVLLGAFFFTSMCVRADGPEPLTLSSFGAAGDDATDDTTALQRAFSAAKGRCLDGEGRKYRVRGTLRASEDFCLVNTRLRQDVAKFDTRQWIRGTCPVERDPARAISCGDPAMPGDLPRGLSEYLFTRTLLIRPEAAHPPISVTLRKVAIDRGDDPASGARSDAAGIWIGNARKVELDDVEVTGAGKGFGLMLVDAANVTVRRLWLHDLTWAPYAGDAPLAIDRVRAQGWNTAPIREFREAGRQGVSANGFHGMRVQEQLTCLMIVNSHTVLLDRPRVDGCRARFAEGDIPWQADGIAVGQSSSHIRIMRPVVNDTWEGIDVVGGGSGVSDLLITGAQITNSFGYGVKWGYSLQDPTLVDSAISQSGLAGVVIYGPVKRANLSNVRIDGVGSVRLGRSLQRPWQQERAGVLVEPGSSAATRELHPAMVSLSKVTVEGGGNCRFGLLNLTPERLFRDDIKASGCEHARQDTLTR